MRWIVGLLLVCAAILKTFQLFTEPAAALASPLSRWFAPMQVGVELGIGLGALAGLYWRQLRWIALLLFTFFAGYSLYLAIGGAASCGCFGALEIHPWWTFFLDLAVVLGLLVSVRHDGGWKDGTESLGPLPVSSAKGQQIITAGVIALLVLSVTLLGRFAVRQTATAEGLLTGAGDLVVLEPEQWVGNSLPIADFIDLDLSSGEWIVLLHRHDCAECQEAVPRYEQLAISKNVALVEVPPYGIQHSKHARLRDDREWFVQTPVEIRLQDGVVVSASTKLPLHAGM